MSLNDEQAWELAEDIEGTEGWEENEVVIEHIDHYWRRLRATHNEGGVHYITSPEEWQNIRAICDPDGWGEHTCVVPDCLNRAEHVCPGESGECTAVSCDDHVEEGGLCTYCAAQAA